MLITNIPNKMHLFSFASFLKNLAKKTHFLKSLSSTGVNSESLTTVCCQEIQDKSKHITAKIKS